MREKVAIECKQFDIKFRRIPEGYNLYNKKSTFISPINTFPWRET